VARTDTVPETPTTTPAPPPEPSTQEQARPSPVLAWPSEWPVPELPEPARRRSRGLPMAPVLTGAGNTTTLATTAAYSAGGPVAAAATGVVIAAGATAALLRRRATVKRSMAARAGGATKLGPSRSGGGSGLRSGTGGGSGRGGSGSRRSPGAGRSGTGSATLRRSGGAPSAGGGSGRTRGGLLGKGTGRHTGPARHSLGDSKRQQRKADKAAAKAAKQALKQVAKDVAAKNKAKDTAAKAGKSGNGHALKAAAGRAARRAGGAVLDGLCALAAGAWALLGRGRKAAVDRLKAVWKRRRRDRKNTDTPDAPTVAATVRRPASTIPATLTGGTTMSGGGHHFVAPAMELARAAAHYQPTGMLQVGADFAGLEEALRLHAEAMKVTVENADANFPLHPNIVELMRQIHGLQLKAAELASELQPAFRSLHDVDIARLENPRQGEAMWDYTTNR
jgi:hypothetical protein